MRSLLLLFACSLTLLACGEDKPTDSDADTDTDADADTDTDTDLTEPGQDMGSAWELTFDKKGQATNEDLINPAGDRDFYHITPTVGNVVLAYTAVYSVSESTQPDTVLRVYDSAGTQITENDDMPYRWYETDSVLQWQATDPGGYYVEVLEWSDWAGESPSGGPDYEYIVAFSEFDPGEPGPNDDVEETFEVYEAGKTPFYYSNWFDEYATLFFGEVESAGDIDIWPIEFSATDSTGAEISYPLYYQWSFFPTTYGSLTPRVTLFDGDGNVLGQTEDPAVYPTYNFLYDAGITYAIPEAGPYYLQVEDATGAGADVGYFYPGILTGFTSALATLEMEPNFECQGNAIGFTESHSTAGYFYGRFSGMLADVDDGADYFYIDADDAGGLDGRYVSVYLETERQGSLLDAKVTLYTDGGGCTLTEVESATTNPGGDGADNPEIWDFEPTSDDNIYIAIEHEQGGDVGALSHYYHGIVLIYDEPLN